MSKRLTSEEFIKKAKQLHNGRYDYSESVYVDSRSKLTIICPEHGRFEQRASSHLSGNGCPKCARIWTDEHKQNLQRSSRESRGMTTDEWIKRARNVHGDKYDYSQVIYVNQKTYVKIICPEHGLFEQNPDAHIRGCGCRLCAYASGNQKGKHSWSDEQRKKTAETCRKRYGTDRYLDSKEGKEKIAKIKSKPEFRKKMSDIISSDSVQHKTKMTSLQRYGVESPAQTKSVQDKIYKTKKKNHTVNSSKSEIKMYQCLVQYFGKENVIHQYKNDNRYPFVCDFYIKSIDLFIELNASWTHGKHWFDNNADSDINKLKLWVEKVENGSDYYASAIDTWTRRDVEKRRIAIKNNLNYVVFWKNDLSDFKQWLEADELVLNNIL